MIIINIKAAKAFTTVLVHKNALELVKPYLKDLLQIFLKLISEHEIENMVVNL